MNFSVKICSIFLLMATIGNYANEFESLGCQVCADVFHDSNRNIGCSPDALGEIVTNILQDMNSNDKFHTLDNVDAINDINFDFINPTPINRRRFFHEGEFHYENTFTASTSQYPNGFWSSNIDFQCELQAYPKPMVEHRFLIYRDPNDLPDETNVKMVVVRGAIRFYKYAGSLSYEKSAIVLPCKGKALNLLLILSPHNQQAMDGATFDLRNDKFYEKPYDIVMPAEFTVNSTISVQPFLKKLGIHQAVDIIQNINVKVSSEQNLKYKRLSNIIVVDHTFNLLLDDTVNYITNDGKQFVKNSRVITAKVVYPKK